MGRSNRRTREKRAARRRAAASGVAPSCAFRPPLAPHTCRCQCRSCRKQDEARIERGITWTDGRRRAYVPEAASPEHRAGWAVSGHALARYMATHDVIKRKNKVTQLDFDPDFLSFLDAALGQHDLDAGRLYEALLVLEVVEARRGSPRGWIVRRCVLEGAAQTEVAEELLMSQPAVAKNLDAALDHLLSIYGGLLLAERHQEDALASAGAAHAAAV